MTKEEYLLTCLGEECAEVAQAVSKALRFGLNVNFLDQDKTNREQLVSELNDLLSVVRLLADDKTIQPEWCNLIAQKAKRIKVEKYMHISQKLGRLDSENN